MYLHMDDVICQTFFVKDSILSLFKVFQSIFCIQAVGLLVVLHYISFSLFRDSDLSPQILPPWKQLLARQASLMPMMRCDSMSIFSSSARQPQTVNSDTLKNFSVMRQNKEREPHYYGMKLLIEDILCHIWPHFEQFCGTWQLISIIILLYISHPR